MRNENRVRDFIFGGVLLILMGLATLFFEKAYFTINPLITLQKTPVAFWILVAIELGFGIYLVYIGAKMSLLKRKGDAQ
jgi:uncharacterized membrane protein